MRLKIASTGLLVKSLFYTFFLLLISYAGIGQPKFTRSLQLITGENFYTQQTDLNDKLTKFGYSPLNKYGLNAGMGLVNDSEKFRGEVNFIVSTLSAETDNATYVASPQLINYRLQVLFTPFFYRTNHFRLGYTIGPSVSKNSLRLLNRSTNRFNFDSLLVNPNTTSFSLRSDSYNLTVLGGLTADYRIDLNIGAVESIDLWLRSSYNLDIITSKKWIFDGTKTLLTVYQLSIKTI